MLLLKAVFLLQLFIAAFGAPEQGKFTALLGKDSRIVGFTKTLYNDSTVKLTIPKLMCKPRNANTTVTVKWLIRSSSCYGEYTAITASRNLWAIMTNPEKPHVTGTGYFIQNKEEVRCGGVTTLTDLLSHKWTAYPKEEPTTAAVNITAKSASNRQKRDDASSSKKNSDKPAANSGSGVKGVTPKEHSRTGPSNASNPRITQKNVIATTWHKAPYLLIVEVTRSEAIESFNIEIHAEMETPKGFLSAHEYPLLTFYMIMCIIYSFYAVAWLVMSACNFRDLLRVQFWIGGVILLGMIEKAVFYSEYLSVNSTGVSVIGASKFAEVVSAMKRSLARMLVIIVSLGFGIVKPRLGPMLHRVIGIGILYFILAVIEALVRTDSPIRDPSSNTLLFASIPLAVIDSIICWWIFMSLMQTMKTLRLRRNVVKLSLYRHFSNTIIFCVIVSLAMIFYSLRYRDVCMTDWSELWVDTAFWHILFSVILLVIMILWRPNINNQRYAFSSLIDGDADEGAEEPMLGGSGATETVKMRGLRNASDVNYDPANKAEEDLKWIEENIPQTVADAALPAIMDSDEEIMTTKYEMSKME